MNRWTWMLLGLLVASLAWAYGASQRPRAPGEERLETVWQVPPEQVQRLEYRSGETRVTVAVEPRQVGTGNYYWVEGEGLSRVPPGRPGSRRAAPPEPAQPAKDAFQGSAQTQRFVEEMANLQAVRVLGPAKGMNLPDFGLSGEGTAYLSLERRGGQPPLRLDLGAVSPGSATRYALSSQDNRVYLVRSAAFRNLQNARRLMDRELLPFPLSEAQRIEVQLGSARFSMYRLNVAANEPNAWGASAQDEEGDPALQEVFNGLLRIKVSRYLPDVPPPDKATATLVATVTKGTEPPAVLTLYPVRNDEGVAVTTYTQRPVALNSGLVNSLLQHARAVAAKP